LPLRIAASRQLNTPILRYASQAGMHSCCAATRAAATLAIAAIMPQQVATAPPRCRRRR